jgi:hypothetical protein
VMGTALASAVLLEMLQVGSNPNREREVLIRPSMLSGIVLPLVCPNHLGAKEPECDLYL